MLKKAFVVNATDVDDSSALLSWQSSSLYISYTVCKYNVMSGDYEDYLVTTHNKIRLTGLSADTSYSFCVKSTVTGELLGAVSFATPTKQLSVKITGVTSCEVDLSFENVKERAEIILYRSSEGKDFEKIATITGSKEYVDTDVDEGTEYSYRARAVSSGHTKMLISEYSTIKQATTAVSMDLPRVSGRCKTYAYYTACNIPTTPQYQLLNSPDCHTDEETGIRMVDDCYCVALGSFYGSAIGTKYRITFSTGNSINVILCDQKANCHTDKNNQYAVAHRDIMEFYVEKGKVPSTVHGDYGRLPQFKGKIISIEKYIN